MGRYSQIPLTWNESAKTLTIGARTGSYTGMPTARTFNVVFVGANHGQGVDVTATPDRVVSYDGTQAMVTAP
jgi:alpha-D-xyloside xylohydrolase